MNQYLHAKIKQINMYITGYSATVHCRGE